MLVAGYKICRMQLVSRFQQVGIHEAPPPRILNAQRYECPQPPLLRCPSFRHAPPQDLPHEGEPVGEGGTKVVLRMDVMYERRPRVCNGPHDREAYRLYKEAELLEADGNVCVHVRGF